VRIFWICVGGAAGTGARVLLSGWLARTYTGFPFGTLAVNVAGSFLLGAIMQVATTTELLSPTLRLALTTGVMGGFTTYSSFNYETLSFLQGGAWWLGLANVVATLCGCLLAGILGTLAGRLVVGS
jgi:fluoride exporter